MSEQTFAPRKRLTMPALSARVSVSAVRRRPRGQRFFRHVHPRVGRGDGELHTHAHGSSVPHQRHGAQRQHPGVRERRLHRQDLGHKDGTVSPNAAR